VFREFKKPVRLREYLVRSSGGKKPRPKTVPKTAPYAYHEIDLTYISTEGVPDDDASYSVRRACRKPTSMCC
jgi:hypothetical protein